jgi:hypothetical protein
MQASTLEVKLLFWQRPEKETDLEYNFFYRLNKEGNAFRSSIKQQSTFTNLAAGNGLQVCRLLLGVRAHRSVCVGRRHRL